jgi:probable rRNA maturation factor
MASFSQVRFFYQTKFGIKQATRLKIRLARIFKQEGQKLETLNYIFCNDAQLLKINQSYLNHKTLTDIITFDLSEGKAIVGEIYISVDRVRENAALLKTSFKTELTRVMIHGILHLCGYSDKTKKDTTEIRKLEDKYLQYFGFT